MKETCIARFSAWAPGVESPGEWEEWALGRREIRSGMESPAIDYTDSMFRRRLSQISKMTVQVVHDLLPLGKDTKMIFLSFRGELSRQYSINRMLIEDKALKPAAFSLSVFNTPAALASIAFGLEGGYSAIYPGGNSFAAGIAAANSAFLCGDPGELIFVYADEEAPSEYRSFFRDTQPPLAFGFLFSNEGVPLSSLIDGMGSPGDFLKKFLLLKNKLSRNSHDSF